MEQAIREEPVRVDLRGHTDAIGSVKFLEAEVVGPGNPIIRVYCSVRGKKASVALRVDLGKQIFLDRCWRGDKIQEERVVVDQIARLIREEHRARLRAVLAQELPEWKRLTDMTWLNCPVF